MPSVRFMIHRAERFPSIVKLQMEGVQGEVRYVRERTCRCTTEDNAWCKRWNTDMVKPDGFCAWGERRDS